MMRITEKTGSAIRGALLLAVIFSCLAEAADPITSARRVRELSIPEAAERRVVVIEGTVTHNDTRWPVLFVQDDTAGIFVNAGGSRAELKTGQFVRVTGVTSPGEFAPVIDSREIQVLGTNSLPAPASVRLERLFAGSLDSQWVRLEGVIHASFQEEQHAVLKLETAEGGVDVRVNGKLDAKDIRAWVDSKVRVTGVAGTMFNDRRQVTGIQLFVPEFAFLEVVEAGVPSPFDAEATLIADVRHFDATEAGPRRAVVRGVVTKRISPMSFFVQDDSGGILVRVAEAAELAESDEVMVAGFPGRGDGAGVLENATLKILGPGGFPEPAALELTNANAQDNLHGRLVRVRGVLSDLFQDERLATLILKEENAALRAFLERGAADWEDGRPPIGAIVEATGVLVLETGASGMPSYEGLFLRSASDIEVVKGAPFWTMSGLKALLACVVGLTLGALAWVWHLRRMVRNQTGLIRSRLEREEYFSSLGREMSGAVSRTDVGRVIVEAARGMFGWDACHLDLWDRDSGLLDSVIAFDTLDGQVTRVTPGGGRHEPSGTLRAVLAGEGKLILRNRDSGAAADLKRFGDETRASQSLLFAPCRIGGAVVGVLSVQSYSPDAYSVKDLDDLQALADHSAGALRRILAEQELAESESKFRTVAESLGEGLLITDLEDRINYANRRIADLSGYGGEELQGKVAHEVFLAREEWPEARERNRARSRGEAGRYEARLRRKDGTFFWAEVLATPFRNQGGKIVGTISSQIDIDGRKRVLEALQRSEQRFSATFHACPVPMCLIDMDEGCVLDANGAFFRVLEFRREEVVGENVAALKMWEDSGKCAGFLARAKRHGAVRDLEMRFLTKRGQPRAGLVSAEVLQPGDRPGLLVSFVDITERLELEEQLRHSQKMEAVGQLAAGVAHDFNNVLTIIRGHAGLLAEAEELAPETRESAEHVAAASRRASELTRQLLAFSRRQAMELTGVDLNAELEEFSRMMESVLGERIELRREFFPDKIWILADVGMLGQIVTNLVVNARDAMPEGGVLTISTSVVERETGNGEKVARGRFRDTGEGMSKEELSRVFEPFFSTKEVGQGTGLGLSTAYGLMSQQNGRIFAESEPGEGSCFTLDFPLHESASEEAAEVSETQERIIDGDELVLAVEDEAPVRDLMSVSLRRHGYRVLLAEDAPSAMEIWEREDGAIDLVLSDIVMPGGLTGFELAERLWARKPELPIVFTSGYNVEINENGRRLRDGFDYLPKPFDPEGLVEIVRRRLDGREGDVSG